MPVSRWSRTAAAVIVAVALVAAVAPVPRPAVERLYANGLFPVLQHGLTSFSNLVPFAMFDLLWIAAAACAAVWAYRGFRRRPLRPSVTRMAAEGATTVAALYLLLLFTWGLNYRRVPVRDRVDFEPSRITREAAAALGSRVAAQLNAFYADAHGHPASIALLASAFADAQRSLGAGWTILPGRPKQTLLGAYFHQTAITGMTDPDLLETMIAPDLLEVEKPFVVAHEWAHLAGYADESEANFVGWLACQRGDNSTRYSAALTMIDYVRPSNGSLRQVLAIGPRTDLYAIQERYAHTSRALQMAAREGYNAYLKANRVRAGVVSYDLVVQLVLGTAFDERGNPVLR